MNGNPDNLLEVRGLSTHFETYDGTVEALDGVEFSVGENETVGIVGESGCGKSVTVRSILQLIDSPGRIVDGSVSYGGQDLLSISERTMRSTIRGREIAMVFQDPADALNPVYTVGQQITEVARKLRDLPLQEARDLSISLMERVGIADAAERYSNYPHEFSGGMKQRILIAKSLACQPKLLIADEPTTALDKTTEAQLLDLLDEMQEEYGLSILLITHDLRVVSRLCDRVVVMYAGQTVEIGPTEKIIEEPIHPYTRKLVEAIPKIDDTEQKLTPIEGRVLDLIEPHGGCRFYERCPLAESHCTAEKPPLEEHDPGHYVACFEV